MLSIDEYQNGEYWKGHKQFCENFLNPLLLKSKKGIDFNNWFKKQGQKTLVMGIVNVTPDSFSDGGKFYSLEASYKHSVRLLKDGADILDIGGESSRPGAKPISVQQEIDRVLPLITKINLNFPQAIISIDTTKAQVAEEAIKAGAKIINDIPFPIPL